jgi:hypothetical protein
MTVTNLLPGQNNEGLGFFAFVGAAEGGGGGASAAVPAANDLFFRSDSFGGIGPDGRFDSGRVTATVNRPFELRVCGHATALHREIAAVSVYLGDPADGVGIARKNLHGIDPQRGSCAWFTWRPQAVGEYTLTAVIDEPSDDAQPGNNRLSFAVSVEDVP